MAQLPSSSKSALAQGDLSRHAAYILCADGSRIRSRHIYGDAAGRTLYVSRVVRNREAHAVTGNTTYRAASKPNPPIRCRCSNGTSAHYVVYQSNVDRNRAMHALNGNTARKGAAKAKMQPKAVAKATAARPKAQSKAAPSLQAATATSQARPPVLENIQVDYSRCLGRVWNAGVGVGRQCLQHPREPGEQFCAQHGKPGGLPHGTVLGEMEPAIREKYERAGARGLGSRGFSWYSRLKLWDEVRVLGKTSVDALTDDEFQRALYNIDRYYKKHISYVTQWRLDRKLGPQSSADRHTPHLVNYLGSPRRYAWYTATIFRQELAAWRPGVAVEDLAEGDFYDLLQRTSTRASNHSAVKNYLEVYSGPQCWTQRTDSLLMDIEPRVEGRRVEYRPKEFEWLECSNCQRWRRVDLATARLFSNWHWRQHECEERRAALTASFPRLVHALRRFLGWIGGGLLAERESGSVTTVEMTAVEAFLTRMGWQEAFGEDHRRALLELVVTECRRCAPPRPCGDVQREIEAAQNLESGPVFRCDMLAATTCEMVCDHELLFARHELGLYREHAAATVHWKAPNEEMSKLEGVVLRVEAASVLSVETTSDKCDRWCVCRSWLCVDLGLQHIRNKAYRFH